MKNLASIILSIGVLAGCASYKTIPDTDDVFRAAVAKVDIEPETSQFSLALAGYGAPWEGRFSIKWSPVCKAGNFEWMAGGRDCLYLVDGNGGISYMSKPLDAGIQKILESNVKIKYLTSSDKDLIGYSFDGKWYKGTHRGSKITWIQLGSGTVTPVALTVCQGNIYICTENELVMEGHISHDYIIWNPIGDATWVEGLTSYGELLIALTGNQKLWKRNYNQKGGVWLGYGYYNDCTFDVEISDIASTSDRLFALGKDGHLYVNEHASEKSLYTSAVAISKGNETAMIIGLDITGIDGSFTDLIRKEIKTITGIPEKNIMINSSHTHFSPVGQAYQAWQEPNMYPDSLYLFGTVKPAILLAAKEAFASRKEARLSVVSTKSVIGGNRCLDGDDAIYDPTVDILKIESPSGKLRNIVFLTGCHPVHLNQGAEGSTLSGNFPAVARGIIEQSLGCGPCVFLQGCAGDVNPLHASYKETARILATDVISALDDNATRLGGEISCYLDTLKVPMTPWPREKILEFRAENAPYGYIENLKNVHWADHMLDMLDKGLMPLHRNIAIQTINIGDWKLIGLSHEAVTKYAVEIRKVFPDKKVSVAGYVNEVGSYLPSREHINAGTYEGYNSFFWYGQPDIFPVDILEQIVTTVKKNNR